MKILNLTLKKLPFEATVSDEKKLEFRKPSKWLLSRLYNKDDTKKHYDAVKFTNGYGKDRPFVICEYLYCYTQKSTRSSPFYSNGFITTVHKNDIVIKFGKILQFMI